MERGAPIIGQHTDEVLREAGYDEAKIQALKQSGIVVAGVL